MNVLITLTSAGTDTGPFNLYSNVDNYTTAFETNISKGILVAGYTSTIVPPGTSAIRVKSIGVCANYVDITLTVPSTTTTTTTGVPVSTSTTTTTAAPSPATSTTTTTTVYVGPSTSTTTTTSSTTTTAYVGPSTSTTTTTSSTSTSTTSTTTSTTSTTTTLLSCFTYNGQNNNVDPATIFWTNCDGSPGSEVVAPSAFSANFCARAGSVSGFGFTIYTIEPCGVGVPTTTTTTTTAALPTIFVDFLLQLDASNTGSMDIYTASPIGAGFTLIHTLTSNAESWSVGLLAGDGYYVTVTQDTRATITQRGQIADSLNASPTYYATSAGALPQSVSSSPRTVANGNTYSVLGICGDVV